jgi:hypothetical protein
MKKTNFFYNGEYFEHYEDFESAVLHHRNSNITIDDLDRLFKILKKDVIFNYALRDFKITNKQLSILFEEVFLKIMSDLVYFEDEK